MASIPEALPYIQFLGQLALIAAASFAGHQVLQARRDRQHQATTEVLSRLASTEFREAYARVWRLPLAATVRDVEAAGKDMEQAIDAVAMTFEVLGVMVHNRMVDIEAVDQAIGGFLRESWRRVGPYIQARREEYGTRRLMEWYQWLAEHLAVESRRGVGAYEAFKDWRP